MDNVREVDFVARVVRDVEDAADVSRTLKGGGGDGTFNDMEARVVKLEDKLDKVIERLGDVRERLVAVETKIDNLPTKDYLDDKFGKMLTRMGIMIGAIIGLVGLAIRFIPG